MATEQELERGRQQAEENATVNVSLTQLEQPKFTNLKLQRDIILNNFIFNTIDDFGVVWVITEIEGWWDMPAPEVPEIPRGFGDGSYDVQGRYTARTMTLNGVFLTPDPSMVEDARDRLTAAVDLVYKGAWLLTGTDPIRASFVRLVDRPKFQTVNARGRTEFQIPLRAPDPIKYSWNDAQPDGYDFFEISAKNLNVSGSGTGTIRNVGTYNVPCILEASGPVVGPATIYNRTTNQLIIIVSGFGGSLSAQVENKQLSFDESTLLDIATLTTRNPHGFTVGSGIYVSGVGDPFDGNYTIESVPTSTTLTYARFPEVSVLKQVSYKSLESNVATLETTTDHGFSQGDEVFVSSVDSVFNGTYSITSVPTPDSFTYQATRVPVAAVTGKQLISNVATLTTSGPHGFLVGEQVTVSGVDEINFNGVYTISSVSSDGLRFSYAKNRTDSKQISNTVLNNLVATITTSDSHGFVVGENVTISQTTDAYNGTYKITEVPSNNRFRFKRNRSTRASVITKAASSGVATLTTSAPHGLVAGERVLVEDVDSTFNGEYTITETPSTTAFSYAKSATVIPTTVVGGSATGSGRWIVRKNLIGNVATLTTLVSHGILVGESVTVTDVGSPFDGTYTVTAVTQNTFSYTKNSSNISDRSTAIGVSNLERSGTSAVITTNQNHGFSNGDKVLVGNMADSTFNGYYTVSVPAANKLSYTTQTSRNVDEAEAGEGAFVVGSQVLMSSDISSQLSIGGSAQVAGSLPFSSANGTATVSADVQRTLANTGVVVKKEEVQFTPGVENGVVAVDADILEINTKDREVAFNGELVGARAKVDVLADFIKLAPGDNIIEFEDNGNPESEATLKIYYRSGWLS